MSAFGTEKVQSTALNLGFPTAYAYAYARERVPERFAPTAYMGEGQPPVGTDFQSHWHQQKKTDADRMVRAKVEATAKSGIRAFTSFNGYAGMPKPVLGQRKFANPSFGALFGTSARRDQPENDAPFEILESGRNPYESQHLAGGVLRTAAGQSYGKARLEARIGQLNKINEAALLFAQEGNEPMGGIPSAQPFAGAEPSAEQQLGQTAQVELAGILQSVVDSLVDGYRYEGGDEPRAGEADYGDAGATASRLTFTESARAFSLIVRVATTGSGADIMNVLEYIEGTSADDGILSLLGALGQGRYAQEAPASKMKLLNSLDTYWKKVQKYLKQMLPLASVGAPYKDRLAASKTYIDSGQFMKLFQSNRIPINVAPAQNAQQALDNRAPNFPGGGPGGGDDDSGDEDDDQDGRGDRRGRPMKNTDSQHGYVGNGGAEFSENAQQPYANNSGMFARGAVAQPLAYAGEEAQPVFTLNDIDSYAEGAAQGRAAAEAQPGGGAGGPVRLGPSRFDAAIGGPNVGLMAPEEPRQDEDFPVPDISLSPAEFRAEAMRRARAIAQAPARAPAILPRSPPAEPAPAEPAPIKIRFSKVLKRDPIPTRQADIPTTTEGLRALMIKVNTAYPKGLPDGKGTLSFNTTSDPANVRKNFIRRLQLTGK
jgi:hypothetical protein